MVIVATTAETALCCFFNSSIEWYKDKPHLLPFQLRFEADEEFLDHVSYLDCARVHEEDLAILQAEVAKGIADYLGSLSEDRLIEIRSIIAKAKTIKPNLKRKYGLL